MKALVHSQRTVFQNPNSNVDFHWYNGSSNKHLHEDYYELIVIIEGDFSHNYQGKTIQLSRGNAVLINPKCYHLQTSEQQSSLLANFSITIDSFKSLTKTYNEDVYRNLKAHSGEPIQLTETELNYLTHALNKPHTIEYSNTNLDYFYIALIHWIIGLMNLKYTKNNSPQFSNYPDWLKLFLEKIQDPEVFCLPISQIYSLCAYSPSRLVHLFTKYLGIPLVQYITNLKINYAKNLLAKTNFSVIDIAYKLNYSSLSYFITLFKKQTGLSPTEYRRKYYINIDFNPEK